MGAGVVNFPGANSGALTKEEKKACIDSDGNKRSEGDSWKDACNSCGCGPNGLTFCTTAFCGPIFAKDEDEFLLTEDATKDTFILIFWTPRGVYFNSSRVRTYFSYCGSRERKERNFWSIRYNLCYISYWSLRICCLGSSYIYSRNRCRYPSLFYYCYYNYCSSHWN